VGEQLVGPCTAPEYSKRDLCFRHHGGSYAAPIPWAGATPRR
jgi:hypothetical protein